MEKKIILQKFKKPTADVFQAAELYYNVLSSINNLKLTSREIQLIAFTAVKGNISYANIRAEFCERYDSSSATINNMISKLKKNNVLVKDGTKVKVNPAIVLNFDNNIVLQIAISHG
jgi:nitric oxide synthase oxygenase domain/subunit